MAPKVKSWGGFDRISREQAEAINTAKQVKVEKGPKTKKQENPLAPDKLPRIDKKKIAATVQEKYAKKISKIGEVRKPKVCSICGNPLNRESFFIFAPDEQAVCRSCRQVLPRCRNCRDLVQNPLKGLREYYCADCKNDLTCRSCGRKIKKNQAQRRPGRKGLYCPECLANKTSCVFCGLPTRSTAYAKDPQTYICPYCLAAAVMTENELEAIHQRVLGFFFRLDTEFQFRPKETRFISFKPELITSARENAVAYFLITGSHLTILKGIPQPYLINLLLRVYAQDLLRAWPGVPVKSTLEAALIFFIRFLYYEYKNYFLEAAAAKKSGLTGFKEFQPLYKSFDTLGIYESYKYLKGKLISKKI